MSQAFKTELEKVLEVQEVIRDIHPLLEKVFPIVIVEDDQFFIYDVDQSGGQYGFMKSVPAPMPVPDKVRASFPLQSYNNRPACIVTPDVFAKMGGYATIFHEFVHCQQNESCEQALKDRLSIARKAQQAGDFMWEINHPFPYKNQVFESLYGAFLEAENSGEVQRIRRELKQILSQEDYEYMVWQEWKEGFARFIENNIRRRLGLEENLGGTDKPFNRVVFYAGGEHYVNQLKRAQPAVVSDIEGLFGRMF